MRFILRPKKNDLELLVERVDVLFHSLDELRLVGTDGPSDVRPNEQCIVAGKYPEHFVGILCRTELVAKAGGDACLHPLNSLLVPGGRTLPVT